MGNDNHNYDLNFDQNMATKPLFVIKIQALVALVGVAVTRAVILSPAFLCFNMSTALVSLDKLLVKHYKRWHKNLYNGIGDESGSSREGKKDVADSLDVGAPEVAPPVDIEGEGASDQHEVPDESTEQSIQDSDPVEQEVVSETDTDSVEVEKPKKSPPNNAKAAKRSERRGRKGKRANHC